MLQDRDPEIDRDPIDGCTTYSHKSLMMVGGGGGSLCLRKTNDGSNCGECYHIELFGTGQTGVTDRGSIGTAVETRIVLATTEGCDVDGVQFESSSTGVGLGAFHAFLKP